MVAAEWRGKSAACSSGNVSGDCPRNIVRSPERTASPSRGSVSPVIWKVQVCTYVFSRKGFMAFITKSQYVMKGRNHLLWVTFLTREVQPLLHIFCLCRDITQQTRCGPGRQVVNRQLTSQLLGLLSNRGKHWQLLSSHQELWKEIAYAGHHLIIKLQIYLFPKKKTRYFIAVKRSVLKVESPRPAEEKSVESLMTDYEKPTKYRKLFLQETENHQLAYF